MAPFTYRLHPEPFRRPDKNEEEDFRYVPVDQTMGEMRAG